MKSYGLSNQGRSEFFKAVVIQVVKNYLFQGRQDSNKAEA